MITVILRNREFQFRTKPGLFSKDKIDRGSQLLIETIEIKSDDTVLDIGCGYGPIGLVAATLAKNGKVYMVDVDIRAVKFSQINAELNNITNVEVIPSDGFEDLPQNLMFDVVVSHPPTHVPKEMLIYLIRDAHKRLNPGGKLYFVTEKRVKPLIQREVKKVFGNYKIVNSNFHYSVSLAIKK